jgi:hypothetical protein
MLTKIPACNCIYLHIVSLQIIQCSCSSFISISFYYHRNTYCCLLLVRIVLGWPHRPPITILEHFCTHYIQFNLSNMALISCSPFSAAARSNHPREYNFKIMFDTANINTQQYYNNVSGTRLQRYVFEQQHSRTLRTTASSGSPSKSPCL